MEREVDLTPRQLVDWLRADLAAGKPRVEMRASREIVAEDLPATGSGLDAEDGMAIVTSIGLLEIAPPPGGLHWVLRLRVEDPVCRHLSDDGSVPDGPEPIGLDAFEEDFLAVEDPEATVTVETRTAADRQGFDRVLARILADRHG